jgi:hypothetical protein
MLVYIAAYAFTILTGITILFQIALALGAPWGEYAMGGKFPGKYPAKMRIIAVFQILILALLVGIVMSKSGLALEKYEEISGTAIWFVVAFFVLGTVLNTITKSKWERCLWAPVNVLLLITSAIVAFS